MGDPEPRDGTPDGSEALLPLREVRRVCEKAHIQRVLRETNGNVTAAAQILELNRSHLHEKLKELGIPGRSAELS